MITTIFKYSSLQPKLKMYSTIYTPHHSKSFWKEKPQVNEVLTLMVNRIYTKIYTKTTGNLKLLLLQ